MVFYVTREAYSTMQFTFDHFIFNFRRARTEMFPLSRLLSDLAIFGGIISRHLFLWVLTILLFSTHIQCDHDDCDFVGVPQTVSKHKREEHEQPESVQVRVPCSALLKFTCNLYDQEELRGSI